MSVKRVIKESELLDEVGTDQGNTVPLFIERLSMIVRSEEDAIAEYDVILSTQDLPEELRETIKEIQNDEKDHLVLLSNIVSRYSNSNFPDNTDELNDIPYPDEDKEIVDVPMENESEEDNIPEEDIESDEDLDIDVPDEFDDSEF